MQAELTALCKALDTPERPVAAIVAGSKVSTKLQLLDFLLAKVQVLIIGGAMANTMLFAKGVDVGRSLVERDMAEIGRSLLAKAEAASCRLMLPVDAVVAAALKPGVATSVVPIDRVPADQMILDIGPATVAAIASELGRCRTLVWNGPVGAFETKPFDAGTTAIARHVAQLTTTGRLMSVAGGGDTLAALTQTGLVDRLSYASAAGGAFLEWLEGRELPGVKALQFA
jgi:phosphoglycerate kinase